MSVQSNELAVIRFANATPYSYQHSMPDFSHELGANKENVRPHVFNKTEHAVYAVCLGEALSYDQLWAVVNRHVYRVTFQDFCVALQKDVGARPFDFTANGQAQCLHAVLLYFRHYFTVPELEPLNDADTGAALPVPTANDAPTLLHFKAPCARSMSSRLYLGDLAKQILEEFDAIKTRYTSGSMFFVPDIVSAMGYVRAARLCELLRLFAKEQTRRPGAEVCFSSEKKKSLAADRDLFISVDKTDILAAEGELFRLVNTMHMLQRGKVHFGDQATLTRSLDTLTECARKGVDLALRLSGRDALLDSDHLAHYLGQSIKTGRDAVSILVVMLRNRRYTDLRFHAPHTNQGAFEDYAGQLLDRSLVEYSSLLESSIFGSKLDSCAWMRNRLCDALDIYFESIRASLSVIKLESLVGKVRFYIKGVEAQAQAQPQPQTQVLAQSLPQQQPVQDQLQQAAGTFADVFTSALHDAA